ncbi:MAG: hypothetical protein CMC15_13990 [Flavobacteriaceae bacterium]|nr:hypothetical protein [Flavobacteriaceae bacterium]
MTPEEQRATQETPHPTWWSNSQRAFLIQNRRGHYIHVSPEMFKQHLRSWGFAGRAAPDEHIAPADQVRLNVQTIRDVDYSGPLAGYNAGITTCNGHRALVTKPPKRIEAAQGEFPMIHGIMEDMFWVDDFDQRAHFFGWLKIAEKSVRDSSPMPGQAVVFAGPPNAGKNLVQDLITAILGGRVARPYQWIIGRTNFNADLFEAEHLMIADEVPFTDLASRRVFGSKIKDITVNSIQTCHGKFANAIHLMPCWRLTISLNEESENLQMLPPLDTSLRDKIMLFKIKKAKMPLPCNSPQERKVFWEELKKELPAFIQFLQNWEIPQDLTDSRFGVAAYQHPDLVKVVEDMAPEKRLMELIEVTILPGGEFEGTLTELEARLIGDPTFGRQLSKLLKGANALQTYMRRLKKAHPAQIFTARTEKERFWRILPRQ